MDLQDDYIILELIYLAYSLGKISPGSIHQSTYSLPHMENIWSVRSEKVWYRNVTMALLLAHLCIPRQIRIIHLLFLAYVKITHELCNFEI